MCVSVPFASVKTWYTPLGWPLGTVKATAEAAIKRMGEKRMMETALSRFCGVEDKIEDDVMN